MHSLIDLCEFARMRQVYGHQVNKIQLNWYKKSAPFRYEINNSRKSMSVKLAIT